MRFLILAFVAAFGAGASFASNKEAARYGANPPNLESYLKKLVEVYPATVKGYDDKTLILRDGRRLPLSDGREDKTFEELLDQPDIGDMFAFPYPAGAPATAPPVNFDPGRVRHEELFTALYGDCLSGGVEKGLSRVPWGFGKDAKKVPVTTAQDVYKALQNVMAELQRLPPEMRRFIAPSAGTYNCRTIAGSSRKSMHAYAAAIDLNTEYTAYWQWSKPGSDGLHKWQNRIPKEIVDIFERHGFIWGGRWYHYDTMHFEYRPDLFITK